MSCHSWHTDGSGGSNRQLPWSIHCSYSTAYYSHSIQSRQHPKIRSMRMSRFAGNHAALLTSVWSRHGGSKGSLEKACSRQSKNQRWYRYDHRHYKMMCYCCCLWSALIQIRERGERRRYCHGCFHNGAAFLVE